MITKTFIHYRYFFFAFAVLAYAAASIWAPPRDENQSIDSMFAMDDDLLASYQTLKRTFGGNEVILVVYQDSSLFLKEGLSRQRLLCEKLRVPGLDGAPLGIATLYEKIHSLNPDRYAALIKWSGFDLSTSLLLTRARELFTGYTHSADGKTAAVVLILKPKDISEIPRGKIVEDIRNAIDDFKNDTAFSNEIQMIGEPVMVADGFRMVQRDGSRLGFVATITLMSVVLICFRSLQWALIPAAMVQFAILLSETSVAILGLQLTIVGSMSTSIITVIAVSTVIHLIIRIRIALGEGVEYPDAFQRSFRELAVPVTYASLTDAVGFGALWFAELEPVQDFATVMVTGALFVLVAYWFLVPTIAMIPCWSALPFWSLRPSRTGLQKAFSRNLLIPIHAAKRFPWLIAILVVGILVLSLTGIQKNRVESDFTKNFRDNSPIVKSYRFVENHLGGAGVWDIMIPAPEELNIEFLARIHRLQVRLRTEVETNAPKKEKGLTKVLSLVDAVQKLSGRSIDKFPASYLKIGMGAFGNTLPQFQKALFANDPDSPNQFYYRIMLRSRERTTSAQKRSIIRQVNQICQEEFPQKPPKDSIKATGFYVLLTFMIDSVIRDQWITFGLAAFGILGMLLLAFRDPKLVLIGLIPNLLPILMVLGAFGWLNIPMNLGIALIAAVAIGLSIDSSIHYLRSFQLLRKQFGTEKALEQVQDQVGRALIYATVALVLGFSSLCFSDFLPTVYFGTTAMVAMLGGLIGNLFLLPFFLLLLYRDHSQQETQK